MGHWIRAAWAAPALLLVNAWSDSGSEQAPGAAIEDRDAPEFAPPMPRAASQQWSIGDPTPDEQALLELMNRARLDPAAEGDRIFTDYGSNRIKQAVDFFLKQRPGVEFTRAENQAAFHGYAAKAPFAFNGHLIDAARAHSQLLKQFDVQSHQVTAANEKDLRGRLVDAGYVGSSLAESVFSYAEDMLHAHAGFSIDYGQPVPDGQTRPYLGHRLNLMGFDDDPARDYREVGVGVIEDSNNATQVGPKIVTIDFAIPLLPPSAFVTGVCWDDKNGNGFYDPGEGIGGVRIDLDVGDTFAISTASGGYAIPVLLPTGVVHVTASGQPGTAGGAIGTQTVAVTMSGANVKVDFVRPPDPPLPDFGVVALENTRALPESGTLSDVQMLAAQPDQSTLAGDVEVAVGIAHPDRAELKLTLTNPVGTSVVLFDHGASGVNLNGTFDTSLTPAEPLSAFVGQSYVGNWTLRVDDTVAGNAGTLSGWTLRVRPQWVRTLHAPATPLFITKLKTKDSPKMCGDTLQLAAQMDTSGALDAAAPADLRLRTADAARTELLHLTLPMNAVKYALKGTSRATVTAKLGGFDLPDPLPSTVYVELAVGGAIVGETVPLVDGSFNGVAALPGQAAFHVDSITTKAGNPSTYTVKGRLAGTGTVFGTGTLEVGFGALRFKDEMDVVAISGTKATYKANVVGLKKLVVDTAKGTFQMTITAATSPRSTPFEVSVRLGDDGFYGAATLVPGGSGSSLTY